MRETQTLLDEQWRGSSYYCLIMVKGNGTRFVIYKRDPLAEDDRSHRMTTEFTLSEIMPHWEKLLPDKDDTPKDLGRRRRDDI